MFIQLCDKTIMLFYFLVLTVQLLKRNRKIHKNIGRKIEFRKTNSTYFFSPKISAHQKIYQIGNSKTRKPH